MSNFLSTNDGEGLPYISWGSDAVQWTKKEGEGRVPFTFEKAIFDVENLKVGWIKIGVGVYDSILDDYNKPALPRPQETIIDKNGKEDYAYKKGFSVNVLFPEGFGEERKFSWSTSQKGSLEAMSEVLSVYEAEKSKNAGKLPVVSFSGHVNKKFGKGSTNIPKLQIVAWVDRPAAFDEVAEAANQDAAPEPVAQSAVSEF
jgi:hypothetical protein